MFSQLRYKLKYAKKVALGHSPQPLNQQRAGKKVFKYVVIFLVGISFVFGFLNWPLIAANLNYYFGKKDKIEEVASKETPTNQQAPVYYEKQDSIVIPKLNIDVPLVYATWPDGADGATIEAAIQKQLDSGVAHLQGTAMPGEAGNMAVFGHSSNYAWSKGKYNYVFAILNKLAPGDEITLYQNHKKYVYQVTSSTLVGPKDVNVLLSGDKPVLSLITCWPPGTTVKRMVVSASQVSPDPKGAITAKKLKKLFNQIPSGQ